MHGEGLREQVESLEHFLELRESQDLAGVRTELLDVVSESVPEVIDKRMQIVFKVLLLLVKIQCRLEDPVGDLLDAVVLVQEAQVLLYEFVEEFILEEGSSLSSLRNLIYDCLLLHDSWSQFSHASYKLIKRESLL